MCRHGHFPHPHGSILAEDAHLQRFGESDKVVKQLSKIFLVGQAKKILRWSVYEGDDFFLIEQDETLLIEGTGGLQIPGKKEG